jgi:hypothetical protein
LNVRTFDPRGKRRLLVAAGAALAAAALAAGCGGGGGDDAAPATTAAATTEATATEAAAPAETAAADLSGVKSYLSDHTTALTGASAEFLAAAQAYYDLAEAAGFDVAALWEQSGADVTPIVEQLKEAWIAANPAYEEMEGVVAGTPSLAEYDVILDAGSSAAEDPESAVPFDLTLADGTVLEQPGNLFNLAEGALWGTLPEALGRPSTPTDVDGDGTEAFGEVLPDPAFLLATAEAFDKYANELAAAGEAWEPTDSDALTALVVMVPTMGEYFGQWKESRFVAGEEASSEAFNVVSRLSDINDILGGLDVIYAGVQPLISTVDDAQAAQTGQELDDLIAFISDLYAQEDGGNRFTPEEADTLGTEAQERAEAIAGQVSQAAAQLGVTIEQ